MARSIKSILALSFAASLSTNVSAQNLTSSSPGFHFFSKPGAPIEDHNADLVFCAVATRGLINGSDAMTAVAASTGGGLMGALIGGIIDGNETRQGAAANTENCMALLGWSVIGLSEEDGHALEAMDDEPPRLREAIALLLEAPTIPGTILRGPFANELAAGGFKVGVAGDLHEVSLSVRAVKDLADAAGDLKPPRTPKGVRAPKPIKTVKQSAIATISTSNSQIVLSMVGDRMALDIHSITLQRLNEDGDEVVYDGAATAAFLGGNLSPKIRKGAEGELRRYDFVAEIPAGIWKVATINYGAYAADLCFGAPAFVINEGETLFLGEMRLLDEGGYPLDQSNLGVAQDILEPLPSLAERVKIAALTNGFMSDCFGSYAYAYDQPRSPFVDQTMAPDTLATEIVPESKSTQNSESIE